MTARSTSIWKPEEEFYRKYLGGKNWALHVLLRENPPGVELFDPENRLVLMTSVLTGTPIPGACRYTAATKSPLTGAYAESEAGGFWGPELKFAGFDGIIVRGQAATPVYLSILDGQVEIRSAENLWGKSTGDVQEAIRAELGDERVRVLQCGPAGEKLIRFANLVNELKHFNGRTGIGAVMGSKKLRAIAVRGQTKPELYDRDTVLAKAKWFAERLKTYAGVQGIQNLGTASAVNPLQSMGMLPAYNFRDGAIDGAERVSAETIRDTIKHKDEGCYGCPVRCKKTVAVQGKYEVDPKYGGPEYETIGAFGPLCGILDMEAIAKANEICNRNAMDTISTGVTIAFAMECAERGLLGDLVPAGLDLRFGNADAMVKVVAMIADRTPVFGDLLAEGSHRAAEKIGGEARDLCMTVKKQELPLHEPRGKWGVGLGLAVSSTGADHLVMAHDPCFEDAGEFLEELKPLGITKPVASQSIGKEKVQLDTVLQCAWSIYN
ncbi:MAG: aldehyde ferredoxin oxidoreductase, partial [Planctomycetes bacterium]|nr:aldehyde ferredoxin oxidoreductase [Planctomycetota bacterium]